MQPRTIVPLLAVTTLALAACGTDGVVGDSTLAVGTYEANVFLVTPAGQSPIDVLDAGGSLTLTLSASGATTGSLVVPASITGGPELVADMAGTATVTGLTLTFDQAADTFVRDLAWSRTGATFSVNDQDVSGTRFTINMVKQ